MTEGDYMKYTTKQGDTFDIIAHKCYGDAELITPIIRANPDIVETAVFDYGIVIEIPEIEKTDSNTYLPPWRAQ